MAPGNNELRPEICVIGAGPGGLAVIDAAAAHDVPTVLVEKAGMGGERLNSGSVPAQALIAAAEHAKSLRNGARFGIRVQHAGVDFAAVNAHIRGVVDTLAPNSARARITGLGVKVVEGEARFADEQTVRAGDVTIKARRFVIATGSTLVVPEIPGLSQIPYLTPETVFDLEEIPRHLIVAGANSIGLELAQVFRRLGSQVTVLESAAPLPASDREAATVVLDALAREGVNVRLGVAIAKISRSLAKVRVLVNGEFGEETVEGSHLLIAAARRPNVDDLGLDAAGIRMAAHGIVLDKTLRTSNKNVYAVGDAAGGPNYVHVADYHANIVIRNALFRAALQVESELIPAVTYTDPELAQVGMLEDEARAYAGAIRVLRWPYRENDRAQVERTTTGHIKVVTDRGGEILGVTIVGPGAGEAITPWTLAMSQKLNIGAVASVIVPYPSYAEVGKRAAMTYFTNGLTIKRSRRIMRWLRRN